MHWTRFCFGIWLTVSGNFPSFLISSLWYTTINRNIQPSLIFALDPILLGDVAYSQWKFSKFSDSLHSVTPQYILILNLVSFLHCTRVGFGRWLTFSGNFPTFLISSLWYTTIYRNIQPCLIFALDPTLVTVIFNLVSFLHWNRLCLGIWLTVSGNFKFSDFFTLVHHNIP